MSQRGRPLDEPPEGPVRVVLSLGSNLGDRVALLQEAISGLDGFEGIRVRVASPVIETVAVGGPDQPDYLNAVLLADTTLSPLELLAACQQVEAENGRRRLGRWGPRTLDIDVITYADLAVRSHDLELPHPRAGERAFVLAPWAALDPVAVLPGETGAVAIADLLVSAPDRGAVRFRADVTLAVGP